EGVPRNARPGRPAGATEPTARLLERRRVDGGHGRTGLSVGGSTRGRSQVGHGPFAAGDCHRDRDAPALLFARGTRGGSDRRGAVVCGGAVAATRSADPVPRRG